MRAGEVCELAAGVYSLPDAEALTDLPSGAALRGTGAMLDGTRELRSLQWEPCADLPQWQTRCAPGVLSARLEDAVDGVEQLFTSTSADPGHRQMLVPARWPDVADTAHGASGLPAALFRARAGMRRAHHGREPGAAEGSGWLEDGAAGNSAVEVEEGEVESVDAHAQQSLRSAGLNATGAVVVLSWGKEEAEQARVVAHAGDRLDFANIPCPPVPPLGHSCGARPFLKVAAGREQGLASYYLTQKLELLTQDGEWHYEAAARRLFVKLPNAPQLRFHARAGAPGLRVSGGRGVVLDGLTFFAATLRAQQSPGLRVSNCSFLYSAASRAAAGNLSAPASNALLGCDRARVEDCTFRFSEGSAISLRGAGVEFQDSMVEWNGWSGLDSAATVGIGGTGARVTHVTLRNNGHGSGLYLSAPDSELRANWVEGQGLGGLQHDGGGIQVAAKAQDGAFTDNWVLGGRAAMLRFDSPRLAVLQQVGRGAEIARNVVQGGMVLKGDEHWVHHNTVERGITLVRAFGAAACGLNAASVVEDNVARVQARGNCTAADGTPVQGLPPATSRNLADAAVCRTQRPLVVSCAAPYDFRPAEALTPPAGAYNASASKYAIPGRRPLAPELWSASSPRLGLVFRPARGCRTHTVRIGKTDADLAAAAATPVKGNVFAVKLPAGAYVWQVSGCGRASAVGNFTLGAAPAAGNASSAAEGPEDALAGNGSAGNVTAAGSPSSSESESFPAPVAPGRRCATHLRATQGVATPELCSALLPEGKVHFSWCAPGTCFVEDGDCVLTGGSVRDEDCDFYDARGSLWYRIVGYVGSWFAGPRKEEEPAREQRGDDALQADAPPPTTPTPPPDEGEAEDATPTPGVGEGGADVVEQLRDAMLPSHHRAAAISNLALRPFGHSVGQLREERESFLHRAVVLLQQSARLVRGAEEQPATEL